MFKRVSVTRKTTCSRQKMSSPLERLQSLGFPARSARIKTARMLIIYKQKVVCKMKLVGMNEITSRTLSGMYT